MKKEITLDDALYVLKNGDFFAAEDKARYREAVDRIIKEFEKEQERLSEELAKQEE